MHFFNLEKEDFRNIYGKIDIVLANIMKKIIILKITHLAYFRTNKLLVTNLFSR